MYDFLLLPALGLCTASFFTAVADRFLTRSLPDWALGRRLAVASLATPLAWFAFQLIISPIVLADPDARAGFIAKWPLYLRDVLFGIGLKLWVCGVICAGVLACYRNVSRDPQTSQDQGRVGLLNIGGALATAVVLPLALDHWIESGHLNGGFVLFVMAWAYLIGALPIAAAALAVLRFAGAAGLRRFGEPVTVIYAALVAWQGYGWHSAVVGQPGASALIVVELCAFMGVLTAWLAVRRANRAAAAAREDIPPL